MRFKVADLVYWHEDAWLMISGAPPKVVYGIITSRYKSSTRPNKCIWNVIRSDTGGKAIIHDSDLNVAAAKVK